MRTYVDKTMEDLTLLFFLLMIGFYILSMLLKKSGRAGELMMGTLLVSICAIVCILTDSSLMQDVKTTIPIFPSVFILLHTIINMIWK